MANMSEMFTVATALAHQPLPRGRRIDDGPTGFPVNRSAAAAGITREQTGPGWRLTLRAGNRTVTLDRARLLAQLPWFVRNLTIKVLLRSRLTPVARLLGHDDTADPY